MASATRFLYKINDLSSSVIRTKYFGYISFGLVILVIFRWLYFVDIYAVNLLIKDEWDLYVPFFEDYSIIKTFLHQHGPHRQGLGSILIAINNDLTGWNTRYLSFASLALILVTAIVYLWIKKKQFNKLSPIDSIIFLIVLLPAQYSVFTKLPNISHGPLPAMLISLFCLSLFIKNLYLRNLLLILINFNMVFTGFGYFIGIITPLIFLGEIFWFKTRGENLKIIISSISILLTLITLLLFFTDYRTDANSSTFHFPHSKPWEYLFFIALSYANLFGNQGVNVVNIIIGLIIISILTYILIRQAYTLARHSFDTVSSDILLSKIIVILIGFSLLFIIGTSIGRIHKGLAIAQASRYMPYLIPSIIGVYLYVASLKTQYKPLLLVGFFIVVIFGSVMNRKDYNSMRKLSKQKTEWKKAYLETESITGANKISGLKIYPKPERTRLQEKLDYLKKNKLNLYLDDEEN